MKKRLVFILAGIVLLGGGGWYAKTLISHKMGEEVVNIIKSPSVQDQLNQLAKSPNTAAQIQDSLAGASKDAANLTGGTSGQNNAGGIHSDTASSKGSSSSSAGSSGSASAGAIDSAASTFKNSSAAASSSAPTLQNRQDAIQFAMSRFTAEEILRYMGEYQNRSKLTAQQKNAIKAEVLSRFTAQEIQAMVAAANK